MTTAPFLRGFKLNQCEDPIKYGSPTTSHNHSPTPKSSIGSFNCFNECQEITEHFSCRSLSCGSRINDLIKYQKAHILHFSVSFLFYFSTSDICVDLCTKYSFNTFLHNLSLSLYSLSLYHEQHVLLLCFYNRCMFCSDWLWPNQIAARL